MSKPLNNYAFINAKLRARISKILAQEFFSQLAKAPSLDAAFALLRDTPFAGLEQICNATGDLKQAELELLKTEIALYKDIMRHLQGKAQNVLRALLTYFEIENLKNALRLYFDRKIRGRSIDAVMHYILFEPILNAIPFDIIVNADNFDEIAGVCDNTPYSVMIRKYRDAVEAEGSLFRLEIALDHYYYQNLLEAIDHLDALDRRVALRLIGVEIDSENISWIIRLKKLYDLSSEAVALAIIPGGFNLKFNKSLIDELYRNQNVASLLQNLAKSSQPGMTTLFSAQGSDSDSGLLLIRRILEEVRRYEVQHILTGYPFSIGIVLAYFLLKQEELRKIRKLLNAKFYGKGPELIESMI